MGRRKGKVADDQRSPSVAKQASHRTQSYTECTQSSTEWIAIGA